MSNALEIEKIYRIIRDGQIVFEGSNKEIVKLGESSKAQSNSKASTDSKKIEDALGLSDIEANDLKKNFWGY